MNFPSARQSLKQNSCPAPLIDYTLQSGDTLYMIAHQYNVTIPELVKVNPAINPYMLMIGQTICIPSKTFRLYENTDYNIRFMVPVAWKRVDDTHFEGKSGFFQISAISSTGILEDVCKSEAFHKLMPYGTRPTTRKLIHLGQDACFIMPSADQPPEMKNQAAIIIKYPEKIQIEGENYNFFVLWADKEYISEIVKTLNFVKV